MLFTSFDFLLFFLIALLVFAFCPARRRWAVLLAASYVFYGLQRPSNLIFLGALTVAVYACGLLVARDEARYRRTGLVTGLFLVLGSLTAFKFHDFAVVEYERIMALDQVLPRLGVNAPSGYSFYSFSAASYLIDLYRRQLQPASFSALALYLAFFPKILAGPIERATAFLPQVLKGLRQESARTTLGLQLVVLGLLKKVVIADNLAPVVDRNFSIVAFASPMELLISSYFFAFQIYCDFSGYSDIAVGLALLFGIVLMDNFRRPYLSRGVAEFWSARWHISLAQWFRDYLYIPLGGSRTGYLRAYFNIMMVFLVSGLWHAGLGYGVGWTFLVWGALNGFYICAGRMMQPHWRAAANLVPGIASSRPLSLIRILITFHLVLISWIFFRAASMEDALLVLRKIGNFLPELPHMLADYPFTTEHLTGAILIVVLLTVEAFDERRPILQRIAAAPLVVRWSVYYSAIVCLLVLGRWQVQDFVYMQF